MHICVGVCERHTVSASDTMNDDLNKERKYIKVDNVHEWETITTIIFRYKYIIYVLHAV